MKHTKSAHTALIYQHLHAYPLSESPFQRESASLASSQETIDPISVPEANWHNQENETRQLLSSHNQHLHTHILSESPIQRESTVPAYI